MAAPLRNWGPMGGENPRLTRAMNFTEAASQSFAAYELVTLSSGKVAIAKAAGNTLTTGDLILGRALSDASGVTDNPIQVDVWLPGHSERLPVYHATAASAITAVADNGSSFGIRNDATQGICLALDEVTATKAKQITVSGDYPVGTQYGLVDVQYLNAALIYGGA